MHIRDRETLRAKGQLPDFAAGQWPAESRFIRPTEQALTILNDGSMTLSESRWGLVPAWAPDVRIGSRMFNARAESAAGKPAFRESLAKRRCLMFATGFVEWRAVPGRKRKESLFFEVDRGAPFAFAGLWDVWIGPDGAPVRTCTMLTSEPNELMRPIHNRMPVILARADYAEWLDPAETDAARIQHLLHPYSKNNITYAPVELPRKEADDGQQDLPF